MSKKIIIIRGPLGVGKTTIAQKLAKILNAQHIQIDKVLSENNMGQVGDISLVDFLKVNELILPKLKKILAANGTALIDHNFYYKEQLDDLKDKIGDVVVIDLKAKLATCIKRDEARERVYGKEAATAVYNLVSNFDYGIPINTEHKDVDAIVANILTLL